MPTIFRPARPSRRFGTRRRFVPGSSILTTAGAAAGIATVAGVAVAIVSTIGSTSATAAVSGVGSGVRSLTGTSAGSATVAGQGSGYFVTVGLSAAAATVTGVSELRQITSTNIIQKPVDYALAGDQMTFKSGRARGRALTHAFGE